MKPNYIIIDSDEKISNNNNNAHGHDQLQKSFKENDENENYDDNRNNENNLENDVPSYQVNPLNSVHKEEVRVIYHISDLHIENNSKTYEEYNHIFEKLDKILQNEQEKNKILVITGDILHERTKLYTETILYTWELLKRLNKILPIIMIPGNHDINMRNSTQKDGITGILYDRITKDMEIHYLLETGLYKYRNLLFCVDSLFDKKKLNYENIEPSNLIKIALYHGILNGAKVDSGFTFAKQRKISDFRKYDYTLLGDIHAFQFLSPNIGYAGSLISQDFGEGESEHGCIRWDLVQNKHEFVPIENKFAYKVFKVSNQNIMNIDDLVSFENIPSNGKVKIIFNDIADSTMLFNAKELLKKSFKVNFKEIYLTFEEKNTKRLIQNNIFQNPEEISDIFSLLNVYLESKFKKDEKEKLFNYLSEEMVDQNVSNKNKCKLWKILSVKWENMFVYGARNKVDFRLLKNVTGLIGRNSSGKSLFLEIILYLLYGRSCFNDTKKNDFINKEEVKFSGEIVIEVDNQTFSIARNGAALRGGNSLNSFQDDLEITLYDSKKKMTQGTKLSSLKWIKENIGDYNDLKKINFFFQDENEKILGMKRKERKEYIHRILNINFMDKVFEKVKEKKKRIIADIQCFERQLNEYYNNDFSEGDAQKNLDQALSNIGKYSLEKTNLDEQIFNLIRELQSHKILPKTRKALYEENRKIKKNIKKLRDDIHNLKPKKAIGHFKQKIAKISNQIINLQDSITSENHIIARTHENIQLKRVKLNQDLQKMVAEFDIIKAVLEDVKNDRKIDKTQLNKINLELISEISKINEEITSVNASLEIKNEENLRKKEKLQQLFIEKEKNVHKLNSRKKTIALVKEKRKNKEHMRLTIENNQRMLGEYNDNEISETTNKKIEEELNQLKLKKEHLEGRINYFQQQKIEWKLKINENKKNLEKMELLKKKTDCSHKEHKFYDNLFQITSVNGFSYYLLENYIAQIQEKMNEVFGVYFNRKIQINLEKDAIDFKIINEDNKPCASMGGCESLLFELAFRISISKIMKIPLCSVLFIDEHLSVIDVEKRYEIKKIFEHLNSYFDKIIVITHDETIKNYVDDCIVFRQEKNRSWLNNEEF